MSAILIENPPMVRESFPIIELEFGNLLKDLDANEFFEFCQENREWRIERDREGQITIMTPTGWSTGKKNIEIARQLANWTKKDGRGECASSSTGYELPDGAIFSPDASWILKDRLDTLEPEQLAKFLPLCPDFVIELRSKTDNLQHARKKMGQYIENGASLGWLIDPPESKVYIYNAEGFQELAKPDSVSGEPFMPGFVLDLTEIW